MAKIVKFVTSIRNNWKKSVFGALVVSYGVKYAKDRDACNKIMMNYCREAQKYGEDTYRGGMKIREVVVFLNPAANKRKAKKDFEKYCAPLLYLAGIYVTVVQTKSQGEARSLAEQIVESVDAVVVAGGDGTLSETVTGLLRRETGDNPLEKRIPVGVLPLGRTNNVAKSLFKESSQSHIISLAEATMAVIRQVTKAVDVIKIEQLEKEKDDQRPVYSVGGLSWGALYDAYAKRDTYWYWGSLRSYMSYIFMGLREDGKGVTWRCSADLHYSLPCSGCSNCYVPVEPLRRKVPTRWWQSFVPKQNLGDTPVVPKVDYSKIENDECKKLQELEVSSVDFSLTPLRLQDYKTPIPCLQISIGPQTLGYWEFITRGWQYIKGEYLKNTNTLQVKDVKLQPKVRKAVKDAEYWFYIDNDDYEIKPIYIKLLPNRVIMFCQNDLL